MEVLSIAKYNNNNNSEDQLSDYKEFYTPEETALVEALSKILEGELRKAKRTHLSAGEVLLPNGLTHSIAQDMYHLADTEPCGLRGCILYINFQADDVKRKLSVVKCDPSTPSTFELYLTLKQSTTGWNFFLPQFLKKITRSGTVMISSDYDLHKIQLYRSNSD